MEVGQKLREAREERGLTLEGVEKETKIRCKYLRALEEEQFQVLPGPVYAKAFFKTYARFLGIDPEETFGDYNHLFVDVVDETLPIPSEEGERVELLKRRKRRPSSNGFFASAAVIVGLVILFVFINGLTGRDNSQLGSGEPTNPGSDTQPQQTDYLGQPQDPIEPQQLVESEQVNLQINIKDRNCWLRVVVDGTIAFEGVLTPGQSKQFEGNEKINVRFGDPGAAEVLLNGQNLGLAGSAANPIDKEFTVPSNS